MPYDFKKFIFSVSLCAMLVANPVLATAPTNDEDLGTTHDVYVESTLNQATNGIAGVSYVNRMVNAAGNAAELAEGHAAAAGAHALSAAKSANEAHKVLADKVSIDQGADNKNKAMVTDNSGSVYAGYITNDMIAEMSVSATNKLHAGNYNENKVLKAGVSGLGANPKYITTEWGYITKENIADGAVTSATIANGAVTSDKITDGAVTSATIANGAVTSDKITDGAVTSDKIGADTSAISVGNKNQSFLYAYETGNGDVKMFWGQIRSAGIAPGAVTIDKTDGVVGMVPVGSADATTYGQFWIE